jgi:hypothetical protein
MLQADLRIGPRFRLFLVRSRCKKQVQVLASWHLVRGDPQLKPLNEEIRWHVPDCFARERRVLGD